MKRATSTKFLEVFLTSFFTVIAGGAVAHAQVVTGSWAGGQAAALVARTQVASDLGYVRAEGITAACIAAELTGGQSMCQCLEEHFDLLCYCEENDPQSSPYFCVHLGFFYNTHC